MYVLCVLYRNASVYSTCVGATDCSGTKDINLFLGQQTASMHADLHKDVCSNDVRDGQCRYLPVLVKPGFHSNAIACVACVACVT